MHRLLALALTAFVLASVGCGRQAVEVQSESAVVAVQPGEKTPARDVPVAPMPHEPGDRLVRERLRDDPDLGTKIEAALPEIEPPTKADELPTFPGRVGGPGAAKVFFQNGGNEESKRAI